MEYLDERFPHPALHQMDPVSRANARMLINRIDQIGIRMLEEIQSNGEKNLPRLKNFSGKA